MIIQYRTKMVRSSPLYSKNMEKKQKERRKDNKGLEEWLTTYCLNSIYLLVNYIRQPSSQDSHPNITHIINAIKKYAHKIIAIFLKTNTNMIGNDEATTQQRKHPIATFCKPKPWKQSPARLSCWSILDIEFGGCLGLRSSHLNRCNKHMFHIVQESGPVERMKEQPCQT